MEFPCGLVVKNLPINAGDKGDLGGLVVKNLPINAGDKGDLGRIPRSGSSPGEGNSNPLQYSCWEIPWTEQPMGLQTVGWD